MDIFFTSPRQTYKISNGTAADFNAYLGTLPPNRISTIQLDGIISVNSYIFIDKPVIIESFTEGSGFSFDGGFIYMGSQNSVWTPTNRGASLSANLIAGSNSFIVPAGFTLAEGDYVILSSDDIIQNCCFPFSSTLGMKPAERHRIEAIVGNTAYTARPIESTMTTTNSVKALNYTNLLVPRIELRDLSLYGNTTAGGSIDINCLQGKILDCVWENKCPGAIRFLDLGDGEISGCAWKDGILNGQYGIVAASSNSMRVARNKFRGDVYHWCVTSNAGSLSNYVFDGCCGLVIEENDLHSTCRGPAGTQNRLIDLHGESYNAIVRNNTITLVGRTGAAAPPCMSSRSRSPVFEGNTFNGVNSGADTFTWGIHCYGGGNLIRNNVFNGLNHGVYFGTYFQSGVLPESVVQNNTFNRMGTSAIIINNNLPIKGVSISNNIFINNLGASYGGRPATNVDVDVSAANIQFININNNTMNRSALVSTTNVTNLLLRSNEFANPVWVLNSSGGGSSNPTVTPNYDYAPDGTLTATRLQLNKGSGVGYSRIMQSISSTIATTYTFSFWAKTANYSNATIGIRLDSTGRAIKINSDWKRFSISAAATASTNQSQIMLYDALATSNSADILIWGAQIEIGSIANTYVSTLGAPVTKSQDLITHSAVDSDLSPEIVRITGNQLFGYGSGKSGIAGTSAALVDSKFGKLNFGDY